MSPQQKPPPPYATHIQPGCEALGTEGVAGPGGQSGWVGRQHTVHLKKRYKEFPGGLVVRTPCFHCSDQVQSLVWELRSCMLHFKHTHAPRDYLSNLGSWSATRVNIG